MPEAAVKTQEQVAIAAIQDLFKQEEYDPQFLKELIRAAKVANQTSPSPDAVIVRGRPYPVSNIRERLAKFVYLLPPEKRPAFTDDSLYDDSFLNNLSEIIDQISGFAPSPPPANIPPDLKALVAEFEAAHQSAVSAQAKRLGWSPQKFQDQIALQNQITFQMHQVRQAALSQLGLVIDNSQYLENLAIALGRKPEAAKRLAKIRLKTLVDQAITAQTFRQARLISKDPSQLAALFTKNLSDNLKLDDLVGMAITTNKKDAKSAFESIKKTVAQKTETAKPAIQAAAENLANHPSVQKTAQTEATAAIKQAKTDIPPAKAARLSAQLIKHQNNPSVQEKLVAKTFGVPPSQAKLILGSLRPSLSQLAASTKKFNPLLAADPDSIAADALRRPRLFPKPFVDAIKSGKITDSEIAEIFQISRLLDIPPNAVILSRWGVNAADLTNRLTNRGLDPQDASVVKLSHLADAQQQLIKSLESPPAALSDHAAKQFLKTSRAASRSVRFSQFFDRINPLRLPPLGTIGNAGSGFISNLRVQSAPINSFFNFISAAGNTIRQTPSFLTRPFRAVGSAIGNTIVNPVKTWAKTQIKSGLAKAGAWLAKKGVTQAAKKIGLAIVGKGTAALLAQAVPVAGQVAGALMLLSTLGDIGKFLWQNRKAVGMTLGGLFFLGQMLLGKLFAALSSLTNILGFAGLGAGIGFMVGGPVGALIGAGIGGLVGWGVSAAGGLGAALSGIGSWLGSAAASAGSFIGSLTAPSAVAGLGSTVAAVGIGGLTLAGILSIFQTNILIPGGLVVPQTEGGGPAAPGGAGAPQLILGPGADIPACWPTSGTITQEPLCDNGNAYGHCRRQENAIDFGAAFNTPVYATHDGTACFIDDDDSGYGQNVIVTSPDGFSTIYAHLQYKSTPFTGCTEVTGGTQIGAVGATGNSKDQNGNPAPHLHYELRNDGHINTVVPAEYYVGQNVASDLGCFTSGERRNLPQPPVQQPSSPTSQSENRLRGTLSFPPGDQSCADDTRSIIIIAFANGIVQGQALITNQGWSAGLPIPFTIENLSPGKYQVDAQVNFSGRQSRISPVTSQTGTNTLLNISSQTCQNRL